MMLLLKRAYEPPEPNDGMRVLVDRLWPRGIAKNAARIDLWLRDIAPSTGLRKWYGHDPSKWEAFKESYFDELERNPEPVDALVEHMRQGMVTLVYAAKDVEHTHALVLKTYLENKLSQDSSRPHA